MPELVQAAAEDAPQTRPPGPACPSGPAPQREDRTGAQAAGLTPAPGELTKQDTEARATDSLNDVLKAGPRAHAAFPTRCLKPVPP